MTIAKYITRDFKDLVSILKHKFKDGRYIDPSLYTDGLSDLNFQDSIVEDQKIDHIYKMLRVLKRQDLQSDHEADEIAESMKFYKGYLMHKARMVADTTFSPMHIKVVEAKKKARNLNPQLLAAMKRQFGSLEARADFICRLFLYGLTLSTVGILLIVGVAKACS